MSDNYRERIKEVILDRETLVRATFSKKKRGVENPWQKVRIRPVTVKDQPHLQFSYLTGTQDVTKNYAGDEAQEPLDALLDLSFRNIQIQTTSQDIHVQISAKGKALIRERRASAQGKSPILTHDRQKERMIPIDQPDPFLQAVGIMTKDGKIKAHMQSKFRQIDEFLRLIMPIVNGESTDPTVPLQIVDLGCGNAYLTFAVYYYFQHILGRPVHMTGVDLRGDLLQKHAQTAQGLGWTGLRFETQKIADFVPPAKPDIVMALHACDTATDEALALGVQWQSQFIFSAPCCHHHLQKQLSAQPTPPLMRPIARHGILNERLGDILTDTCRASILRVMGYQTDVVEFVPTEHTPRNLLIRATRSMATERADRLQEYQDIKNFWAVTPHLEALLASTFPTV